MSESVAPPVAASSPPHGWVIAALGTLSFVLGSIGLLGAMAIDALAVLGRHLGLPLLGSIELVQACVVLMGSSALVGTTVRRGHASVQLVTERVSPRWAVWLARWADLVSALVFATIGLGSLVVLHDLWDGDERSELLALPYAPLRLMFLGSIALVVVLLLGSVVRRRAGAQP